MTDKVKVVSAYDFLALQNNPIRSDEQVANNIETLCDEITAIDQPAIVEAIKDVKDVPDRFNPMEFITVETSPVNEFGFNEEQLIAQLAELREGLTLSAGKQTVGVEALTRFSTKFGYKSPDDMLTSLKIPFSSK